MSQRPIVFVTGASRSIGIGSSIAKSLAQSGWDVALTYWWPYDASMPWGSDQREVQLLRNEIENFGVRSTAIEVDLSLADSAEKIFDIIERDLGAVTAMPQAKIKMASNSEAKLMTVRQPRYSKEEFARRGNEIYESQVRSQVEEGNHGKIVAINIETGAFEVADTSMTAVDRLYEREPNAQPWVIRIGHRAVFRFGSRSLRKLR